MKTAFAICTLLALAMSTQAPSYPLSVPRSMQASAVRLIQWMVQSGMKGDAWVLRLTFDGGCGRCSLLSDPKIKNWPALCNPCVAPFLNQLKKVKGCEKCHKKGKDCNKCQKHLRDLNGKEVTSMNKNAQRFLQKIQYV